MKLVTRIKPKSKPRPAVMDSGLYDAYPDSEKVFDLMWGFVTMTESVQSGNTAFEFDDIINRWHSIAFDTQLETNPHPYHIPRICAGLYLKSCREFKIVPPRGFMLVHKELMSNKFMRYTEKQVQSITNKLSEFILTEITASKGD